MPVNENRVYGNYFKGKSFLPHDYMVTMRVSQKKVFPEAFAVPFFCELKKYFTSINL